MKGAWIMKKILGVIGLSCLAFAWSCDWLNPAKPDRNPLLRDTIQTTVTIGTQGGSVVAPGLSMTIPTGVFTSNTGITVERSPAAWAHSDIAASDIYGVSFSKIPSDSLRLHIALHTGVSADSVDGYQIFIGYASHDSAGNPDTTFIICDSVERTGDTIYGAMTVRFTSSFSKRTLSPAVLLPPAVIIGAVKYYYCKNSTGGHFRAYGHWARVTPPDALLTDLEDAWTKLEAMGFDMSKWRATKSLLWWPFRCYIYPSNVIMIGMPDNSYAYFRPNPATRNWDEIGINARYVSRANTMRVSLGHEFFHAIQSCYLNEDYYGFRWFMEASSAWFETKMGTPGWIPTTIINSPKFYKDGLEGITASDQAFHGYPHFLFVAYLASKYGDAIVPAIWKEILLQSVSSGNAAAALQQTLYTTWAVQLADVYRDFIRAFVKGQILSYTRAVSELTTEDPWTISKADILNAAPRKTTAEFPDVSARMVSLTFTEDVKDVPLNTPYTLTFSPANANFVVYLMDDVSDDRPDIATIDAAHPEFVIPSVASYAGKTVLAVMVNTAKTNSAYSGRATGTLSNKVNYLDGTWTWNITPVSDGCNEWWGEAETFTIKLNDQDGTLMMLNTQDTDPIPASSYTVTPTAVTIKAGTDEDGFVMNGTIVDENTWRADLTIHSFKTDNTTNTEIPCTSTATVLSTRVTATVP
jgi:hypothetical protein